MKGSFVVAVPGGARLSLCALCAQRLAPAVGAPQDWGGSSRAEMGPAALPSS